MPSNPLMDLVGKLLPQKKEPGLHTDSQLMRNLLEIGRRTGDAAFLDALEAKLRQEGRRVELRETAPGVSALFSGNPNILGETTGRFGLPAQLSGGPRAVALFPERQLGADVTKTLQGRNPLVQAMLDTLRHELGHVAEGITPGVGWNPREDVARAIGGEVAPAQVEGDRLNQVLQFLGLNR